MKRRFTQKLQWQYFASYLAVMLVIMTVFLTYTSNRFAQFHTQIVLGNYANRLGLVRSEQESVLTDMVAITGQLMEVTSGVPFEYLEEMNKAVALRKQLEAYRATHDTLEGIYVNFYEDDFIHTSQGSYLTDRFVQNMLMLSGVNNEEVLAYLQDTRQLVMLPMQTLNGYLFQKSMGFRNMVPVFVPVSAAGGVRCGTAMFLVEDHTYAEWFASLVGSGQDVYILQDDTVLVSRQVTGVPAETVLTAAKEGWETLRYKGRKYYLLQLPGDTFSYSYVMLLSDEEMMAGINASIQMLALISALVGALGILFIHYFVQKRMKPIKLLHSMISDREPTGNELIEIRDGIQRLIEKNAAMTSEMEDMETLRKSDFVRRFLTGAFKGEDEYLSFAESIRLNVDVACFAVIIIAKPDDAEYELTADKINRLFDDVVSGVSRSMAMHERMAAIAFADDEATLMDFLEQKLAGLRACCTGITMAVSGVHSAYQEGQRAYLEAENAFELRFIKGNAQPLRFRSVADGQAGQIQQNQQAVDRLRKALHAGDAAQVSIVLREITRAMRGIDVSLFDFRCIYNDILNVVSGEARALGVKEEEVYDLFKLSQCLSLDDLDTMLHHVCSRLIMGRSEQSLPDVPETMLKAQEIIKRRFSEPGLSVSAIAAEVGMTDSKLSTDFKKAFRMTPLECITRSRMHRARRLLRTTDMPVKDIALECGYYDISGFNRRFKVYTGMTPQQYKQSSEPVSEQATLVELPQDLANVDHQEE